MQIQEALKKIDLFGDNVEFLIENNSTRVSSAYGGIMSIITLCFLVFSFAVFGQDFYYKRNPNVIIQDKLMESDEITTLIYTGIYNKTIIFKASKFLVDVSNFLFDTSVPHTFGSQPLYGLIGYCPEAYILKSFYGNNSTIAASEINKTYSFLCYDLGMNRFGLNNDQETGSDLILPISIWTFKCGKSARGIKGRDCPTNIDLTTDKISTLEIWTDEILYNQDNLTSPFYSAPKRVTKLILSRSQTTSSWLAIKMHWSHDNLGFMLDSFTDLKDYGASDVYTLSASLPQPKDFYDFTLYTGLQRKYVKYSRIYMKFQDLLAIVGGVVKSVFTFFQIVLYYVNDRNIKNLIISKMNYDSKVSQPPKLILEPEAAKVQINSNIDKSNAQLNLSNALSIKKLNNNYLDKANSSNEAESSLSLCKSLCCMFIRSRKEIFLYECASKTLRFDTLTSTYKTVEVIANQLFNKEQLAALHYAKSSPTQQSKDELTKSQLRSIFEQKLQQGQYTNTDLRFLNFLT